MMKQYLNTPEEIARNFFLDRDKYVIPPPKTEESQLILKDANKYLITSSVLRPECQILITSPEIKHLKKQFWKFSRRY